MAAFHKIFVGVLKACNKMRHSCLILLGQTPSTKCFSAFEKAFHGFQERATFILLRALIALLPYVLVPDLLFAAPAGVKGNPKSIELNESGAAAMVAKEFTQAEELFKKSLAADTGNLTAVFNLAGVYLILKKEGAAVSLLEEYTAQYGQDAGLFVRLGDAYFTNKQVDKASKAYEKAYAFAPRYSGLAAKLGSMYTFSRKLDKAEQMYLQAVEQKPKDVQLLANLSSIFLANGKAELAVKTAKRGLQVQPSSELYVTMGSAYEVLKDYKSSVIAFQRAQDLGDSRPELKEKVEALKKLGS